MITSLAFHLPQFHRIPENDAWWGEGFTEWTHLRRARRWSRRHAIRRPVPPLGEYCLTDPATLELQWDIASKHGIDGFAIWDYWFGGGRQLLERPIETVLEQRLHFRYCLAWANHSWYDKSNNRLLCRQEYPGPDDYRRYFDRACRHFESDNYVKIDGRPVFVIYAPHEIPDWSGFFELWRTLARERGFPDMYLVADRIWEGDPMIDHLDGYSNAFRFLTRRNKWVVNYVKEELARLSGAAIGPRWFDFRRLMRDLVPADATHKFAPTVITGWDTTPRHGRRGMVFEHLDLDAFRGQLARASAHFARFPDSTHLLFLKSWNEWAEGNVLEPDSVYGTRMLEEFKAFKSNDEHGDHSPVLASAA